MKKYFIIGLLALWYLLSCHPVFSQKQEFQPVRGPRPPIDLSKVPKSAYKEGVILIKLKPAYSNQVDELMKGNIRNGFVNFGIKSLDQINSRVGVKTVKQALNSAALGNKFTERHRAWGFPLWFELSVDVKADIKALVEEYSRLDEIEIAEPRYKYSLIEPVEPKNQLRHQTSPNPPGNRNWTPNDTDFSENQWDLDNTGQYFGTPGADISMLEAWDIEKGSSDVIVAIIDGGIQLDHPDLAASIWSGIGYNFVDDNSTIIQHYHGTHVAGTVGAVSNNNTGIAGIAGGSGTGNGVRLMSCQVFTNAEGAGVELAPIYAADNGAAISQNSWSYDVPDVYDQVTLDAIDYFNANGGGDAILNGGITIFASGNSSTNEMFYPAAYSEVLAIGATNNSDEVSYYTTYGSWVDLSAPGGEVIDLGGFQLGIGTYSTSINSGYEWMQGTSMACPHVSGVAALIVSYAYGLVEPDDIRNILVNSTDNIDALNPNLLGSFGSGRLNAHQALVAANDYITSVTNPESFTATSLGVDQVLLNWTLNSNNDFVMIAFNQNGDFDIPSGSYQIGETLADGSEIVYYGQAETYTHSGLESGQNYYYRIWSVNNQVYSYGLQAIALTGCNDISTFPWTETFENTSATLNCWEQIYELGQTNWIYTNGSYEYYGEVASAYEGTQNAMFPTGEFTEAVTKFVTPVLDISNLAHPELNFWFTQEWSFLFGDYNRLKIYYRTSPQSAWVLIDFIDNSVDNWTQATYDLPEPSSSYQVAFEGTATFLGGPNLLDYVTVSDKPDFYWTGTTDSNWSDPSNWNLGVPGENDYVIISSSPFNPQISSDVSVKSLVLENGATLTIESGGSLTVGGQLVK